MNSEDHVSFLLFGDSLKVFVTACFHLEEVKFITEFLETKHGIGDVLK